ncbi:MAG: septum formation initiator family protein [Flavobacteriaceae bacterium]|nr:septum formation initiator family protein [Flavobacteriaceae bacterium]
MKFLELYLSFFNKIIKLKYSIIILIFLIWMVFLDTHSWQIHNELNNEINQLEAQKIELEKNINQDKNTIEVLKDPDSLEVFGRRNYNLKKDNETIFYVEFKDTLD